MNYTTATDFEVNLRLFCLINDATDREQLFKPLPWSQSAVYDGRDGVDYCNDWAAIGPLIEKYYGDIAAFVWWEDDDIPRGIELDIAIMEYSCGLKRAAAICIIKVLEGE